MKKRTKSILAVILSLCLCICLITTSVLPALADVVIQDMPKSNHNIKELVYYDTNPDPAASQYGTQDFPAVWALYDDPDGHENSEIFSLKEAASQEEARNKKFGMDGFRINGKWYKVIALWTVNPSSDIIDKGNGEKAVFTPLYYSEGDKPQQGETIQVALYDYEANDGKGGISNLVDVKVPGPGGQTEVTVSSECTHQNKETKAEVKNVSAPVTIDGKSTNIMLVKEAEKCTDCQKQKTTRVYRLRFKSRKSMKKYLSGKTAKLMNGKKVHLKGTYEKAEKVFWNKKHIKISVDYLKKNGSVILEFSDEFLAGVEDGVHELMVLNGDEFTAMSFTVSNHEMTETGAFDTEDCEDISSEEYDALMQECEEDGVEIVDCDMDAFYEGGFMTDADDKEVLMSLSADAVPYTGDAVTPPAVTLTSEAGVVYTEDEDYTLTYYQVVEDESGETTEVEIDRSQIRNEGKYMAVATPTRSGTLSGEAWATFSVVRVPVILGDADGDGTVTVKDVTAIQRHAAEFILLTGIEMKAADIDGDGTVTISDATAVQMYLAEFKVDYPVGEQFYIT